MVLLFSSDVTSDGIGSMSAQWACNSDSFLWQDTVAVREVLHWPWLKTLLLKTLREAAQ